MESQTKRVYKPRAHKVPGGDLVESQDNTKPHEPIVLRDVKRDIPAQPKWVLGDSGWEQQ